MGKHRAELTIVVDATPQRCFEVLMDHERLPEWQSAVRSCEVLARDRTGRGTEVAFEIDAKIRTVRYSLAYSYEEPHRIDCDYLGGDLAHVSGGYDIAPEADGSTRVSYAPEVDVGFWVPGRIFARIQAEGLETAMRELKERAEAG